MEDINKKMYESIIWHIKNSITNGKPETCTRSELIDWLNLQLFSNELPEKDRIAIFKEAVEKWGIVNQVIMVMEECGEMMDKLGKLNRGRTTPIELAEELADVTILMEQMAVAFDVFKEFKALKSFKLARLKDRLAKSKSETIPH